MEVGFCMAKYSYELKRKNVNDYLSGKGGYEHLRKKYQLTSTSLIKTWVANYKAMGDEGLKRSRRNKVYSFEKKMAFVEYYLTSEISYQKLAVKEGITNPAIIANWVCRYHAVGIDGLRSLKRGRRKNLSLLMNRSLRIQIRTYQ